MNYMTEINKILSFLKENHRNFFLKKSEDQIKEFIEEHIKNNPIMCDEDFTYLIRLIIKKSLGEYDSHTRFKRKEKRMPLYFKYLKNGFYVTKTADGYDKLKYAKLMGINGIPIEKVFSEIEKATCFSTYSHLLSEAENQLSRTEVLILPSISKNSLTYQLMINGKIIDLTVNITENNDYDIKDNQNFHYSIINSSLILTYNSCKNFDLMQKTVEEIEKIMKEQNINNFILDLRGNDGGNSGVIMPLIDFLSQNTFNIVTLVDRYVFSSGRWAVGEMRKLNSILIGEEIGTSLNCFGENKNYNLTINDNDYTIAYSTKYFGFDKNYNIVSTNLQTDDLKNTKLIFDYPEIYVEETVELLKESRDLYLEKAFEYIESKEIKLKK